FGSQSAPKGFERPKQRPLAGELHRFHHHLQSPTLLVDGNDAENPHEHSILRIQPYEPGLASKHHRPKLCLIILQGEVAMPGRMPLEVRNLTFYPDTAEATLE